MNHEWLDLIDLIPVQLKYYPFIITLDKCIWSCNSANDLSLKIYVPNKTKNVNVKVFNMIANILVKHISY